MKSSKIAVILIALTSTVVFVLWAFRTFPILTGKTKAMQGEDGVVDDKDAYCTPKAIALVRCAEICYMGCSGKYPTATTDESDLFKQCAYGCLQTKNCLNI